MNDTDKEVLRKVYQDQMNHLKPQLTAALDALTEADLSLIEAQLRYANAVARYATLEGRVDALKELAAKEGITLE